MSRTIRLTAAVILLLLAIAVVAGADKGSFRTVRARPTVFGYQVGDYSKDSKMDAVIARFGKTYMSGYFGHSMAPVYRTSDKKAYVVFAWSDGGLETVMVTKEFTAESKPPAGAAIRTISVPSTQIRANKGVRLGDSPARVRRLLGEPDIKAENKTRYTYVSEWYVESGKSGKKYPVYALELVFKKDGLASMEAQKREL